VVKSGYRNHAELGDGMDVFINLGIGLLELFASEIGMLIVGAAVVVGVMTYTPC